MFTIAKKEIVTNQNVVRITVNTGIPLSTNYYSAEKAITKMLTSNYNVYSGNNYEQLVAAWIETLTPKKFCLRWYRDNMGKCCN